MQNKTCIDDRNNDAQPSRPVTGADQRQASRGANRSVALALVGVAAVFLAGAFGIGLLVLYGPY